MPYPRATADISLPPSVAAAVWRGDSMVRSPSGTTPTGWPALDAELPGNGWPSQGLIEILQPQASLLEWRLTAAALQQQCAQGNTVIALGSPHPPHASGLAQQGLRPEQLVWIQASNNQDRLWALEQLIRAHTAGTMLAWLPQAHPEQIRRLQISAQQCQGLVFIFRPESCRHEASAAPLRVLARCGALWSLQLHLLKRRGPAHTGVLDLHAVPHSLAAMLTPRMLQPGMPVPTNAPASTAPMPSHTTITLHDHALGRTASPLPLHASALH